MLCACSRAVPMPTEMHWLLGGTSSTCMNRSAENCDCMHGGCMTYPMSAAGGSEKQMQGCMVWRREQREGTAHISATSSLSACLLRMVSEWRLNPQ